MDKGIKVLDFNDHDISPLDFNSLPIGLRIRLINNHPNFTVVISIRKELLNGFMNSVADRSVINTLKLRKQVVLLDNVEFKLFYKIFPAQLLGVECSESLKSHNLLDNPLSIEANRLLQTYLSNRSLSESIIDSKEKEYIDNFLEEAANAEQNYIDELMESHQQSITTEMIKQGLNDCNEYGGFLIFD